MTCNNHHVYNKTARYKLREIRKLTRYKLREIRKLCFWFTKLSQKAICPLVPPSYWVGKNFVCKNDLDRHVFFFLLVTYNQGCLADTHSHKSMSQGILIKTPTRDDVVSAVG